MKRLLNRLTNAIQTRTTRKPTTRLALESLEDRQCLSVTIDTIDAGHTLRVLGDDVANTVTITQDDDHNKITVVVGSQTKTFTSSQITKVVIDLKGGNDNLTYRLGGGSDFQFGKVIQAQLGVGSDTAKFDFFNDGSGGSADIEANLSLEVNEAGVSGAEVVDVLLGKVEDVAVTVKTRLGFGNDTFTATLKDDLIDDANVKFDLVDVNDIVLLGIPFFRGGNDKYTIKADSNVDIDDNAVLDVVMKGASGADTLDFAYAGEIDGLLKVLLDGGAGADTLKANFAIESDSDGALDVKLLGNTGNDNLTLNVNNAAGNDLTILNAVADGGAGTDTCVSTPNVTKISC